MPRLIDAGAGDAIEPAELIEALEASAVDTRDEDAFAALGPLLARLGRNRGFLASLAIAELKGRCREQAAASSYGAQVVVLAPPSARFLLRANFWPAASDAVTRASGASAFFYGMPHDHNFPFLTYGYMGPGYWSDYYDYAAADVAGAPGEPVDLRFVERARLEPDRLMLYRPGRDIHVQLPPDAFSVSLNILGRDAAQPWRSQYRFDLERGCIAEALTTTPAEALVALAVQLGGGNGRDLAEGFARTHPAPRMRVTAWRALASTLDTRDERLALWERAAGDTCRTLAAHARAHAAILSGTDAIATLR